MVLPLRHYGTREVVLEKEHFQRTRVLARSRPALQDVFPLDLLSAAAPWHRSDRHSLFVRLEPIARTTPEEIMERAEPYVPKARE